MGFGSSWLRLGIGNEFDGFEDTVSTLLSVAPAVGPGSLEIFLGACVASFVAAAVPAAGSWEDIVLCEILFEFLVDDTFAFLVTAVVGVLACVAFVVEGFVIDRGIISCSVLAAAATAATAVEDELFENATAVVFEVLTDASLVLEGFVIVGGIAAGFVSADAVDS